VSAVIALAVVIAVVLLVVAKRRRRNVRKREESPLAGFDTGVRFARRVPGPKWLRPGRGF
jgi:hypothetical protein